MRVLIIDDEKNICSSLSGFLEDLGHKAEACFDGGAGLQKALEESFDLIFLFHYSFFQTNYNKLQHF